MTCDLCKHPIRVEQFAREGVFHEPKMIAIDAQGKRIICLDCAKKIWVELTDKIFVKVFHP